MTTIDEFQATLEPKHPKIVITRKQRRLQLLKLFIVAVVCAITVVLTVVDVAKTVETYTQKQQLKTNIQKSIKTATLIHNLQKERGLTALVWGLKLWNSVEHIHLLQRFRKRTDKTALVLKDIDNAGSKNRHVWHMHSFSKILNTFRSAIDNQEKRRNISITDHLHTYSSWVSEFVSWLPQYTATENLENYANLVLHIR